MVDNSAPAWFCAVLAEGLQRLVALALPGQPPAETIALTGQTWIETLWAGRVWVEALDAPRFATAFRLLCQDAERWPAPKLLLARMPNRPEPLKLEGPQLDKAQIARNRERLQALREQLGTGARPAQTAKPARFTDSEQQRELARRILEAEESA